MNGIEKITEKIIVDAQTQCDKIAAETENEIKKIKEHYDKKATASADAIIEKAKADGKIKVERIISNAHLDGRKQILAAKQELVIEAFDKAAKSVYSLSKSKYVSLLVSFAKDAMVDGENEIIFSKKDKPLAKDVIDNVNKSSKDRSLTLVDEPCDLENGFVIRQGNVYIKCDFKTIADLRKQNLVPEIAKILFD